MAELSRTQIVVYGGLAVVALMLGARWIRQADASSGPADTGVTFASQGDSSDSSGSSAPPSGSSGDPDSGLSVAPTSGDVVVHVAGEVSAPGVYRLPAGSRVTDAVDRAGGPTQKASVDAINLAARLADGQQIVVPAKVAAPAGGSAPGAAGPAADDGPISLGSATVEQLDTIEGIGPVTAQDIIDFRDQNGGISSVDDLDQVTGIGPATMEALRARLQP